MLISRQITIKTGRMMINRIGMKAALTALLVMMSVSAGYTENKVHVVLGWKYNFGLYEHEYGGNITRGDAKMYGNALHLTLLYDVLPQLSVGAGIGSDRYENPGYNTFPAFVTAQFHPMMNKLPKGYIFTNLGAGIHSDDADAFKGFMGDLGVGYTLMFHKHFGLDFQLGYDLKEFKGVPVYEMKIVNVEGNIAEAEINLIGCKNFWRHSIQMSVGLVF